MNYRGLTPHSTIIEFYPGGQCNCEENIVYPEKMVNQPQITIVMDWNRILNLRT
jgi:hypothetical protein